MLVSFLKKEKNYLGKLDYDTKPTPNFGCFFTEESFVEVLKEREFEVLNELENKVVFLVF